MKGGIFIKKEHITSNESINSDESPRQIYDRVFKRIFSLSDKSIIHLINGLFGMNFPMDSSVKYPNKNFVLPNLKERLGDIIVIIGGTHVFHLEAQMTKDEMIILRVFEYGFLYALSIHDKPDILDFPEPAVIYLNGTDGVPEESVLHISFGNQGSFDYHVKNYLYLAHNVDELDRRKMAVLIPFQVLRLRSLLSQWKKCLKEKRDFDANKFYRLRDEIKNDIINSINLNLELNNITADDARQLHELTNLLYTHICRDFKPLGGDKPMNPLLPGALELPNDKYRLRITELEKENARYADENARYADEIVKLKKQIEELKSRSI